MEVWERECIREHLIELAEVTVPILKMAISLGEQRFLDKDEVEKIMKQQSEFEASKLLFDIAVTRKNSYKAIGKNAYDMGLSGTFSILLKGLVKHLLQQSGIDLEDVIIERIIHECENEDALNFFLSHMEKQNLFDENWIPSPRGGVYILRHISNRIKVDSDLFKQKSPDTFVFIGISRPKLSKLAVSNRTASSSDVILQRNTTARFVLLENERDWEQLMLVFSEHQKHASKIDEAIRFVHLIKYDNNTKEYILLRSTSPNEIFSKYVQPHHRDKSLYISEEQFGFETAEPRHRNAFCICDTPGMGKTWLLENLARRLQKHCSNRMVAFVNLSEFAQRANLSPNYTNDEFANIKVLMEYLCPFSLVHTILIEALKRQKTQLELFLDGFDEIPKERLTSAQQFFKKIVEEMKNVRLFVTSRPHMRPELEETFQAVAHDILPFSEEDQVEYLVGYWKRSGDSLRKEKLLRIFAAACLLTLKRTFTKEEIDLMGIPLLCHLLATVNLMYALLFCSRDKTSGAQEFVCITSMNDMYKRYVEMGIDKATGKSDTATNEKNCAMERKKSKINSDDSHGSSDNKREKLKTFHIWKALELLHPQLADAYFEDENISVRNPTTEVISCGFLQISGTNKDGHVGVTFLHRTIAEFLVAGLFAEILTGHHTFKKGPYLQNFVQVIFHHLGDANSVFTINFLNASLESWGFVSVPYEVAVHGANYLKKYATANILMKAIRSNHWHIVRLIKSVLLQVFPNKTAPRELLHHENPSYVTDKTENEYYKSCCEYISTAARYSNLAIVTELESLYEGCFGENMNHIYVSMSSIEETPLHHAATGRNYSVVEYLSDRISLQERGLLFHCVESTKHNTAKEVTEVVEICKLLLGKCEELLHEQGPDNSLNCLFSNDVHVEIIKFLIEQGADTRAVAYGQNILLWHFNWLDMTDFSELFRFLISGVKAVHLLRPSQGVAYHPLMRIIIGGINVALLEQIVRVPGINLNDVDDSKNNLVHCAIGPDANLKVVKLLVENGVDPFYKDQYQQGALHKAVQNGSIEIVEYLVSIGLSLEDPDIHGNTPFHYSRRHLEMMKYLISQNGNIFAVNKYGNNFAHFASDLNDIRSSIALEHMATLKNARFLFEMRNRSGESPIDVLHKNAFFRKILDTEGVESLETEYPCLTLEIKNRKDKELSTELNPLHVAVAMGNLDAAQRFISKGLPLEGRDDEGNTPILMAAKYGMMEAAKFLISKGADPFVIDCTGNNIAHKFGPDLTRDPFIFLTCQGILKDRNKEGRTPLHEWITAGETLNPETTVEILKISGDVNAVDGSGRTMFLSAVAKGYTEDVVKCLLELGSDPRIVDNNGQSVLHIAASQGHHLLYKYCESLGISTPQLDHNGDTPLFVAAKYSLHRLKQFITPQTVILSRNSNGQNISHVGKLPHHRDSAKAIRFLLKLPEGPQLFKMVDNEGQTPLHSWIDDASQIRYFNATVLHEILQTSGVDLYRTDKDGNTMFDSAIKTNRLWVAKHLAQLGFDINVVNDRGENALHRAVRRFSDSPDNKQKEFAIMEFLISIGCDTNQRNKEGLTPLQLVVSMFPKDEFESVKHHKMHYMSSFEYLCTAVRYSQVVLGLYGECFKDDFHDICVRMLTTGEMHDVAEKHDYSLVEYLAGHIPLPPKGLLYHLVENTKLIPADKLQNTLKYLEVLLQKCTALTNQNILKRITSPLFAQNAHVDLMKFLILQGAETDPTNAKGDNLMGWILKTFDNQDFNELCRFLVIEIRAFHLFRPYLYQGSRVDPLPNIVQRTVVPALNHILAIPEIDLSVLNERGDNLVLCSILSPYNGGVECLVKNGVDVHHKNIFDQGALHLVAQCKSVDLVEYFLSHGISLEGKCMDGNTPLLEAFQNLPVLKYLISKNANVSAVNNDGDNVVHLAAKDFQQGTQEVVEYLLFFHPTLFEKRNTAGETPTDILCTKQYFPNLKNIQSTLDTGGVKVTAENGYILFLLAIASEQRSETLKFLLKEGVDLSSVNRSRTALFLSAKTGNLDAVKILGGLGIPLDGRNAEGKTPLLLSGKNMEVAKYLISQNANPFVVDHQNNNIAHNFPSIYDFAAGSFTLGMYQSLLKATSKKRGGSPLHEWIKTDTSADPDTIMKVVRISEEDINAKDSLGRTTFLDAVAHGYEQNVLNCLLLLHSDSTVVDNKGQNALHLSARKNGSSLVKFLESIGVSPHLPDYNGNTPLLCAIERRDLDLVQDLIEFGADPHHRNIYGQGTLHLAAECGDMEFVEYFVSKGCSLETTDIWGYTPLLSTSRNLEVLEYLISLKANVKAVDNKGNNIAHLAAGEAIGGMNEVVDFLLSLDVAAALFQQENVEFKTPTEYLYQRRYFPYLKKAETASTIPGVKITPENCYILFQLAIASGQRNDVLHLLMEQCMDQVLDPNVESTALHLAAKTGNLEATRILVSHGLSPERRDKEGNTPLLLAGQNIEVAKYLILKGADPLVLNNTDNNLAHVLCGVHDFAADNFSLEMYQSLFKARNNVGRTPLHEWIATGITLEHSTIVNVFKMSCADVDAPDNGGRTMFLSAVVGNYREDVLDCLLYLGADPKRVDNNGQNAIHLSTQNGDQSLFTYLESLEVSRDVTDHNGDIPLFVAAKHGLHRLMHFISPNTDVLVRNVYGQNIAHAGTLPVRTDNDVTVLNLLQLPQGPELFKTTDNKGQTPLHFWIDNPNESYDFNEAIVENIFEKCQLDLEKADQDGNTMFLSAVKTNSISTAQQLQQLGCNTSALNNCGDNALHLGVRCFWRNHLTNKHGPCCASLKYLIYIGCNRNHCNSDGFTPSQLAFSLQQSDALAQNIFREVIDILQ